MGKAMWQPGTRVPYPLRLGIGRSCRLRASLVWFFWKRDISGRGLARLTCSLPWHVVLGRPATVLFLLCSSASLGAGQRRCL